MKGDSLDKLSSLLKEMGVKRCVLHFNDNVSRKKILDDEVGQRSIAMFRFAMGSPKPTEDELVEYFEHHDVSQTLNVMAAERQKEDDVLVLRLRDGYYVKTNLRGVEFWVEQYEFKNEPCKKWWKLWK